MRLLNALNVNVKRKLNMGGLFSPDDNQVLRNFNIQKYCLKQEKKQKVPAAT